LRNEVSSLFLALVRIAYGVIPKREMKLRERWISFINESASGARPSGPVKIIMTGGFFLLLILAFIYAAFRTDRHFGFQASPEYPVNLVLGAFLLVFGIGFWIWSVKIFAQQKGTPVPLRPPRNLITTGPYELMRNPMLTGVFFTMFGIGFMFQSISLVFIYTPMFILLNFIELKLIEEPELERRLGQPYREYKQKTPMFWPKGRKKGSGSK